jgi:hypothetical protein
MGVKISTVGVALAAMFGAAALAGSAVAMPAPVDPDKVQSLATQIETALGGLGCGASTDQYITAIQSTISTSGATPSEAEAALEVVQASHSLCGAQNVAVASVDKTIELSMAGSGPAAGIGPGGGAPIGAPPAYVSGGGSDYLVR